MSASSPDSQPTPVSPETTDPPTDTTPAATTTPLAPDAAATPPTSPVPAPPGAPVAPGTTVEPHHAPDAHHPTHFWLWVMCLTGVDYFSTLAYQPSIAFAATGRLMPLATLVLVLVTLFGALPVYRYVVRESPHGQGSIAMLERLVSGWGGKFLVLVLLGFAVTDFVITKTLSAADAAEHLVHNPNWPWPVSMYEEEHDSGATPHVGQEPTHAGTAHPLPADAPPSAHETVEKRVETGAGGAEPSYWIVKQHLFLTMGLLVALGAIFLRGFREVIFVAVGIVGVYLTLNLVIVGSGLAYVASHPEVFHGWWDHVQKGEWAIAPEELAHFPISGRGFTSMLLFCLILFPKLALGLSGFETGAAVMPLVKGDPNDDPRQPAGRIRNARKLLLTAALIMSFFLITSSWVVCLLIMPEELDVGGAAENRALAFLAHGQSHVRINPLFGPAFGTLYDLSTVAILWFAGASAMSGLLNLIPRYLPRYGMAPAWASALQPMVIVFTAINLFVTWIFDASVLAQGGAYATGVMVLISSACIAGVIDKWRRHTGHWLVRVPWAFLAITIVFLLTTLAIIIEKPEGLPISACFIGSIIFVSLISRVARSTELRYERLEFVDERSRMLWDELKYLGFPVLVPHRPGGRGLADKEWRIRKDHRLPESVPVVFLEVSQGDVSEFYSTPLLEVTQSEQRFVVRLTRCASIAHAIAAVSLELSKGGEPPELHFGWSDESPVTVSIGFVLFGEGNVPWIVRELIRKAEPDEARRPRVVIG